MMIFRNKIVLVIAVVATLVLRLVVMAVTYHPDVRASALASYLVVEKGKVINLYDLFYAPPKGDQFYSIYNSLGTQELNSPPLAYFVPSLFRLALRPLIDKKIDMVVFQEKENLLFLRPDFMFYLILIKFQNLVADVGLAVLLTLFFKETMDKWKIFFLWMLNPVTLYASFAMGQRDIWPTMLSVAAAVLLLKKRPYMSAVMLGLGGSYKIFPLLFLLPMAFYFGRSLIERLKIIGIGLGVYLAVILPYAIVSPGYRVMALFAPQTEKMLFAKINVSGDQYISFFVIGFVILVYISLILRRVSWFPIWTGILLLLYSVTHYHPQWFLWITPWLAILWVKDKSLRWIITLLLLADVGVVLSFDSSLHYGLFAPIFPMLRDLPYGIPSFISKFIPFSDAVSVIRSFLAGTSVILFWRILNFNLIHET